ncbi:hypothetical protein [Pseudalkalibacillus berkeleyi]|uniref:Uncharacterized protein n=1 Tax=Pseudalkalibacillus berkeleyi TaxID=1069813 RepID=A0ABS9H4C9_9BACL|nr:hypothetical protein [Pseudalkalibacillus berkeleyi]MCF6138794.1 hypothetical protein [Pseudalkalibacillus berkeleyi]
MLLSLITSMFITFFVTSFVIVTVVVIGWISDPSLQQSVGAMIFKAIPIILLVNLIITLVMTIFLYKRYYSKGDYSGHFLSVVAGMLIGKTFSTIYKSIAFSIENSPDNRIAEYLYASTSFVTFIFVPITVVTAIFLHNKIVRLFNLKLYAIVGGAGWILLEIMPSYQMHFVHVKTYFLIAAISLLFVKKRLQN